MKRISTTQLIATPTVYGEDSKKILESIQIKPTEQSKRNDKKLVDYFQKFESKNTKIKQIIQLTDEQMESTINVLKGIEGRD